MSMRFCIILLPYLYRQDYYYFPHVHFPYIHQGGMEPGALAQTTARSQVAWRNGPQLLLAPWDVFASQPVLGGTHDDDLSWSC